MGSAFKDGTEAGLSDLKGVNASLSSVALGTDPYCFSDVLGTAGRISDFVSRFRSGFGRIGDNLHGDTKSWADKQKQRLLSGCDGMQTQGENLKTRANEALDKANQAKSLRDNASSDESKKPQLDEAEQRLKEARDTLRSQIDVMRGCLNEFYDLLRDVNTQFKSAIALAKNGADNSQTPIDQVLGEIRSLEDQLSGKISEEKNLFSQRDTHTRAYLDLTTKIDEKMRAEQDADRALTESMKKDPPVSLSDLKNLEQISSTARQAREGAETERTNYWMQTLRPAEEAYWAKVNEAAPLKQKLSELKQRRDSLMEGWNVSKVALAELVQEYQEPSL